MFNNKWEKKYKEAMYEIDVLIDHHKELAKTCRSEGRHPDAYRHTVTYLTYIDALDKLKEIAES